MVNFFHQLWCSSCTRIERHLSSVGNIPKEALASGPGSWHTAGSSTEVAVVDIPQTAVALSYKVL